MRGQAEKIFRLNKRITELEAKLASAEMNNAHLRDMLSECRQENDKRGMSSPLAQEFGSQNQGGTADNRRKKEDES